MVQKYNQNMKSKKVSSYLLLLGMAFLVAGIATDQVIFSWLAIALVLISLILGGRWLRKRKKRF